MELWAGVTLSTPRTTHEADDRALLSWSTGVVRLANSQVCCLVLQSTCNSVSEGVRVHAKAGRPAG